LGKVQLRIGQVQRERDSKKKTVVVCDGLSLEENLMDPLELISLLEIYLLSFEMKRSTSHLQLEDYSSLQSWTVTAEKKITLGWLEFDFEACQLASILCIYEPRLSDARDKLVDCKGCI
jgi:hypothetical protein